MNETLEWTGANRTAAKQTGLKFKVAKWVGITLGGVLALIFLALAWLYISAGSRLAKTYDVPVETVTIPTDPGAIESGKHWAAVYCADCHGNDMTGAVKFDNPAIGRIEAHNLTPGKGGVGAEYTDSDWVRAIRHGVSPEGTPLLGMPSGNFYYLSDKDLGDIIAYMKSLPPVDGEMQEPSLTPLGRVLLGAGIFGNVIDAETIDHAGARPNPIPPAASPEYGQYLVRTIGCRTCHGANLAGGRSPDPSSPPAPNLTGSGALKGWTEETFVSAARTGTSQFMPWQSLRPLTDDELKALWLYLRSLQ